MMEIHRFLNRQWDVIQSGHELSCRDYFTTKDPTLKSSEILQHISSAPTSSLNCRKSSHLLPDQDWVRVSLDQFQPIKIGGFWVKPSWNDEPTSQDLTILNLDPGLAFGTGMHPTTQLCLEWLSANPPSSQTVMDFGCGSGILGVAAGCLGASQITGLDIDPQALIATEHNASLNHLVIETLLPDQTPSPYF